jgi:hypothetical protein
MASLVILGSCLPRASQREHDTFSTYSCMETRKLVIHTTRQPCPPILYINLINLVSGPAHLLSLTASRLSRTRHSVVPTALLLPLYLFNAQHTCRTSSDSHQRAFQLRTRCCGHAALPIITSEPTAKWLPTPCIGAHLQPGAQTQSFASGSLSTAGACRGFHRGLINV